MTLVKQNMDDTTPLLAGQDSTQSLTSFKGSTELDHAEESHGTKRPVCVTSYRAVFFVVVFVHSHICCCWDDALCTNTRRQASFSAKSLHAEAVAEIKGMKAFCAVCQIYARGCST